MLAATDKAVGDFEQMLRERNQWDNTLLIVTADNGGETRWGGNNYPLRNWSILKSLFQFVFFHNWDLRAFLTTFQEVKSLVCTMAACV